MADEKTIYLIDPEHLTRPAPASDAEIFARTLARLTRSRDYWQTRALLAEMELIPLKQQFDDWAAQNREAYKRAQEAETESLQLRAELELLRIRQAQEVDGR